MKRTPIILIILACAISALSVYLGPSLAQSTATERLAELDTHP